MGAVPADYLSKVSKLTWVVQPQCRLAAVASSSGIGVGGWADSIVRTCISFASKKKPEEYRKHVAEWREESEVHALLVTLVLAVTVVPTLRFVIDKFSGWAGVRALTHKGKAPTDGQLRKWREAVWKLFAYVTLQAIGLSVTLDQPYVKDTTAYWKDWPLQFHPDGIRFFYYAETAHYLYGMIDLLVWETRRKDFAVMVVHHIVTMALLGVSFHWGFLRIGAIIMLLHDMCDIWMEAAKLAKYARAEITSTLFFIVFLVSWVLLRLTYFPFVVIRSVNVEAFVLLDRFGPTTTHALIWAGFDALLLVLLCLHVYWFYFIFRIAVRAVRGNLADERESDDEEDEEPADKKKAAKKGQ